jgi:hypothetical protein
MQVMPQISWRHRIAEELTAQASVASDVVARYAVVGVA